MFENIRPATMTQYNVKKIAWILAGLAIILAVRPAFALFSNGDEEKQTIVVTAGEHQTGVAGLASAAMVGLDDALPTTANFPDIHVVAAMAKELGGENPFFVYRSNARWPLASVTKLMTAVVALETLGPATILDVPKEAVETDGVSGNLRAGDKYSVIDLVRAMLTVSSNDAAMALAQGYDKKQLGKAEYDLAVNQVAAFTAMMQEKARSLGMSETYYGDPSGLSVINQSVITDLENLVNYIDANHPEIFEITSKKETTILERRSMTRRTLLNINEYAGQADFVGGKTGFIDASSGNLLSIFKYEGKKYLIIVLGTVDRFGETTKIYEWIKEMIANNQSAIK